MKTVIIILLSLCLALSLWLHYSNERETLRQSDTADAAVPIMVEGEALVPPDVSKIDFSDTGLSDEAWKLEAGPDMPAPAGGSLSTESGAGADSEFKMGVAPSSLSIPSIGTIPTNPLNGAPATNKRLNSIITN